MFKGLLSTMVGVVAAGVALPAIAADDIDSKVQLCAACHGQAGGPIDPKSTPIIWGQQESYLVKQIHDYRAGFRDNSIMAPIAKTVAQQDTRAIGAYFAAKTWPAQQGATPPAAQPEGIAMCKACHGQNFEGGPPAPRLAGLSYEYLIGAMNGFADGQRTNNFDMPGFMKALTPSQREAIAHYLAAL